MDIKEIEILEKYINTPELGNSSVCFPVSELYGGYQTTIEELARYVIDGKPIKRKKNVEIDVEYRSE